MAGGINKEFLNDPEAFLQTNVVMVSEGIIPAGMGTHVMNLRPQLDGAQDQHGVNLPVYKPHLASGPGTIGFSNSLFSKQFAAFYVPWQPDRRFMLNLDNSADIMFTPGLSGCTFAASGGANPRVGHFNYLKKGTDRVSRSRTYQKVSKEFGGRPAAYISKSMYPIPGDEDDVLLRTVHIIGFRTGGGWRFLAQYLDRIGNTPTGFPLYRRSAAPAPIHDGMQI